MKGEECGEKMLEGCEWRKLGERLWYALWTKWSERL